MTYETMYWEAEAKRVARAFRVEVECEFLLIHHGWGDARVLRPTPGTGRTQSHGMRLTAHFQPKERTFELQGPQKLERIWIVIPWDGQARIMPLPHQLRPVMVLAKGLFHLGLLSPEIEALLKLNPTAHEKLEWALEYENGMLIERLVINSKSPPSSLKKLAQV